MLPYENNSGVNQNAQIQNKNVSPTLLWRDLLIVFSSHWWLFLICVTLTCGVAQFYLLSTAPRYIRQASVMIKVDQNSAGIVSSFSDMGLMQNNLNINNEIFTLKSSYMMEQTIRQLHLQMDYSYMGIFRKFPLYGESLHITAEMPDMAETDDASFIVHLRRDSTYVISDFQRGEVLLESNALRGKLGMLINTPLGKVRISPSMGYAPLDEDILVHHKTFSTTRSQCMDRLNVKMTDENTSIILLEYQDESPAKAEDILSAIIAIYDANWVKDRNQISVSTSEFIADRLKVIEGELGTVESDISEFKSANLIAGGADESGSQYVGQITSAQQQINDLNTQLYMVRYVRSYLTAEATKFQLLPTTTGLDGADITSQITEYNQILLRRNNVVSNSSVENPIVVDLDQRLSGIRSLMLVSLDNIVVGINARMRQAQAQQGFATSKVANSPDQAKQLLNIERQQKVKESLYLYLLQKREENELSQAFTAYNTRVITPASGSEDPSFPNQTNIWLIAVAIGILVPGVILFLLENINNSVRGRKDLDVLTIPFIGEIPLLDPKGNWFTRRLEEWRKRRAWEKKHKHSRHHHYYENKELHIVVKDKKTDVMNEAFRVIRTNLEFMSVKGEKNKVIMLTSFNPNSGKTFVISNIATALAIKGKTCLLIDLDLRKASLSALVGSPKQGVSDYLSGMVTDFHEIIKDVEGYENILHVMPVGTIPPNPTELLFEDRLHTMIEALRGSYDYIFLDCPPVEIVADATIVAKSASMTLFIIRAEHLDRALLPEVQKYYDEQRLPKMAVILNGTTDAFSYYGYHRYGSRYGYYGYGRRGYGYGYAKPSDD